MISNCPPCECNDSHVMRNTLYGMTGLGTVVVCRVFWGFLKRKFKWLWEKVFDDVRDNVNEQGSADADVFRAFRDFQPLIPEMMAYLTERRPR